jgi:hypothetical protein
MRTRIEPRPSLTPCRRPSPLLGRERTDPAITMGGVSGWLSYGRSNTIRMFPVPASAVNFEGRDSGLRQSFKVLPCTS